MNDDLQGLLNKSYFYLRFRPRTIAEMRRYLYKKIRTTHWSTDAADSVINHLIELDLLNDKKFIEWFVEQRKAARPKGRYVLQQELLRYGIEKKAIEEYFGENILDEEVLAERALRSRWSRFSDLDREKQYQKASQFLLRRGFGYAVVKKTVKKLMSCFDENSW